MSSLIEQAVQRLEQLRQAGIEIPDGGAPQAVADGGAAMAPVHAPAAFVSAPASPVDRKSVV